MTLFPGLFSKECVAEYNIDPGKEIIYAEHGARRIEAVTSSPRAIEGGRPTFVIINESHHWLLANEGRAMAEAIRRNLGKSRDGSARSMEITNAHLPDEGSVAEDTYEAARKANFKLPGVYYDSLEAPPVEDLSDVDAVRAALVLARGDSVWLDIDRLAAEIADPTTPEGVSRRFYFNQVTRQGGTWLPAGAWDNCAEENVKIKKHRRIVLALDGSYNGDTTALLASSIQKNAIVEVIGCWEAPPEDPAWRVPIADVEEEIREACRRYDVEEVNADPFRWSRSLEALEAEGLPVQPFPQSPQRMTPATTRFYEAVVNKLLRHNGDPRLSRHIANAVLKQDSRGIRLAKETKSSPRKTDLAVAAVMAYDRAMTLLTEERPDMCETCGGPLDEYGRCETCPPQIISVREAVERLQREAAQQGTERKQMPTAPEQQPFQGSPVPVVTRHEF